MTQFIANSYIHKLLEGHKTGLLYKKFILPVFGSTQDTPSTQQYKSRSIDTHTYILYTYEYTDTPHNYNYQQYG